MIRKIMSLALMAVLIFPPLAVAADPPDLKGRWIGKTHSIIPSSRFTYGVSR